MGAYDDKQFGVNSADSAEGDKGVAMKRDVRYDGPPEEDVEYEGIRAHGVTSAAQMAYTGRE